MWLPPGATSEPAAADCRPHEGSCRRGGRGGKRGRGEGGGGEEEEEEEEEEGKEEDRYYIV